jgi:biotin operon repressor
MQDAIKQLEQLITDANTEKYLSAAKVAEMLSVDESTLWR